MLYDIGIPPPHPMQLMPVQLIIMPLHPMHPPPHPMQLPPQQPPPQHPLHPLQLLSLNMLAKKSRTPRKP